MPKRAPHPIIIACDVLSGTTKRFFTIICRANDIMDCQGKDKKYEPQFH